MMLHLMKMISINCSVLILKGSRTPSKATYPQHYHSLIYLRKERKERYLNLKKIKQLPNNQTLKDCPLVITLPKYYVRRKNQGPVSTLHTLDGFQERTRGEMNEDNALNETGSATGRRRITPTENAPTERQEEEELPIALRKHPQACVKPIPHVITNYLNYVKVSTNYESILMTLNQTIIPNTTTETAQYPHWKQAMDEEMQALINNRTWNVVELKQGIKLVGCTWVFTIKYNSHRTIERYKARLVTKRYT